MAAMFFKMAGNYGRCNSPMYLKTFSIKSLNSKAYSLTVESRL